MIKPYIKNETAVEIICSICDRMYTGMDCEPADCEFSDCEWMKMLEEEAVDAVPVVHGEVGNALSKRDTCCRGVCINMLRYVEQSQERLLPQLRCKDGRR
jgi:hypothetical protein|nr:MAG TPA: hypothetical protein [Caudoviricetes sp.]